MRPTILISLITLIATPLALAYSSSYEDVYGRALMAEDGEVVARELAITFLDILERRTGNKLFKSIPADVVNRKLDTDTGLDRSRLKAASQRKATAEKLNDDEALPSSGPVRYSTSTNISFFLLHHLGTEVQRFLGCSSG